jgi:hypothetical protein
LRFLLIVLAVTALTGSSQRRREIVRDLAAQISSIDRFVNVGVRLHIVEQDPTGYEHTRGAPRVRDVDVKELGGIIDTRLATPEIVAKPHDHEWRTWLCSREQFEILDHADSAPAGQLVYGSEGAGKTTALVFWLYRRWLDVLGERREIGITAPTQERLETVFNEIRLRFSPDWYHYSASRRIMHMCDGTRVRMVSTYRQSASQGSPVQGFNWSAAARDEGQDQVDVHEDIESRGRSAAGGRYRQLITATAKDAPSWRELRDKLLASGEWVRRELSIFRSPFIAPTFIEAKKLTVTEREFRRRYGNPLTGAVEDIPPESRLYFNWSREHNLRPVPLVGARKITSLVLSRKTGNPLHGLLVGHDPGVAKSASVIVDAYDIRGEVHWWVRGELFTMHKTTEQHALELLDIVRKRFGVNVSADRERAHVRAMPTGLAEDKPDLDVYRIFKRVGFDIRAAQYRKDGTATGVIDRESRIELMNMLLCDASGRRRLFVECDELRRPVAPKLVESLESIERDESGRISRDKNLDRDKSDAPDALGYALWAFEKESASALKADIRKGIG